MAEETPLSAEQRPGLARWKTRGPAEALSVNSPFRNAQFFEFTKEANLEDFEVERRES